MFFLNSNGGWNIASSLSFLNMPILHYANEIRSAVLLVHGEKAHSCYFSRDAFENMTKGSKYTDNKELLIIPGAFYITFNKGEIYILPQIQDKSMGVDGDLSLVLA